MSTALRTNCLVLAILLALLVACYPRHDWRVHPIDDRQVGISCADEADPTVVRNDNGTLIVSCGLAESE